MSTGGESMRWHYGSEKMGSVRDSENRVGLRRRRRRRKRSGDGDGDGSAVCGYRRHSELWRRAPITVAFAFSLLVA